jgi:hypothetical protein
VARIAQGQSDGACRNKKDSGDVFQLELVGRLTGQLAGNLRLCRRPPAAAEKRVLLTTQLPTTRPPTTQAATPEKGGLILLNPTEALSNSFFREK